MARHHPASGRPGPVPPWTWWAWEIPRSCRIRALLPHTFVEHRRYFDGFLDAVGVGERVLPGSVLHDLTVEEMDVCKIVQAYSDWLAGSDLPKLFVNAEPGAILVGEQRELCRGWPNQRAVTVKGRHFLQEDAPDEIGRGHRRGGTPGSEDERPGRLTTTEASPSAGPQHGSLSWCSESSALTHRPWLIPQTTISSLSAQSLLKKLTSILSDA